MTEDQQAKPQLLSTDPLRAQFPGLSPEVAALDGAAGTRAPQAVIDAVAGGLRDAMANQGGAFAASERSSATQDAAREAGRRARRRHAGGRVFGPNMTTLTFHIADALSTAWRPGDELVVTSLDHDANVRPWVRCAERAGARVQWAEFDVETGELGPRSSTSCSASAPRSSPSRQRPTRSGRGRTCARSPIATHATDALVYVDGVHSTPHVADGRRRAGRRLLRVLDLQALRPSHRRGHRGARPARGPATGEAHPGAGGGARAPRARHSALRAARRGARHGRLDRRPRGRRPVAARRLTAAYAAMETDSRARSSTAARRARRDRRRARARRGAPRTPTVSFVVDGHTPTDVARALAQRDIAVWYGDIYAYELMRRYGLRGRRRRGPREPRPLHDASDVDRLVAAVAAVAGR